jgi:hypothetical protein
VSIACVQVRAGGREAADERRRGYRGSGGGLVQRRGAASGHSARVCAILQKQACKGRIASGYRAMQRHAAASVARMHIRARNAQQRIELR